VKLRKWDVLHIPGLSFDGLVGHSPIATAKQAIGSALAVEEYGSKFFANGANPGGVLEFPGTVKDIKRVKESLVLPRNTVVTIPLRLRFTAIIICCTSHR